MSRVCVKGLPKACNEEGLRKHFASMTYSITDVKVCRTKQGVSRQFAFIGFRGEGDATKAISEFNRTFMASTKLTVEAAKDIGQETTTLQRSAAWHSTNSSSSATTAKGTQAAGNTKNSNTPTAYTEKPQVSLAAGAAVSVKNKEQLAEYLALSRSRTSAPTWANDDAMGRATVIAKPGQEALAEQKANKKQNDLLKKQRGRAVPGEEAEAEDDDDDEANNSTDSEEYQEVPKASTTKTTKKKPAAVKKPADSDHDESNSGSDSDIESNAKKVKHSAVSDLDYMRSKKVGKRFSDDDDDAFGEDDEDDENGSDDDGGAADDNDEDNDGSSSNEDSGARNGKTNIKSSQLDKNNKTKKSKQDTQKSATTTTAPPPPPEDETIDLSETGRLFIRNLPYACTDTDLRDYFTKWGPLADLHLPVDANGKLKGFAYVTYLLPEHAVVALSATDGKIFQGRLLHVLPAKPSPNEGKHGNSSGAFIGAGGDVGAAGQSSYKTRQEEKKRAGAGGKEEADNVWNTLFVRTDTAVAAAAEKLGVTRGELLDRDAGNVAVRVALAETQVVAETKAFLASEGVVLATLETALGTTSGKKDNGATSTKNTTSGGGLGSAAARSDTTILVKNLPPNASADALRDLFGRHGELLRFVMPPARVLALVEYGEPRVAKRAFSALAYSRFQRVPLYLEWAPEGIFTRVTSSAAAASAASGGAEEGSKKKRKRDEAASAATPTTTTENTATSSSTTTSTTTTALDAGNDDASAGSATAIPTDGRTLFVKNLSFITTEEGLRDMFATVGPLRSVRIPKRRNPKYRPDWTATATSGSSSSSATASVPSANNLEWLAMGYGFVEYATKQDAEKAIRTLQGKVLDDHSVQLKISSAGSSSSGTSATATATTTGSATATKASAASTTTTSKTNASSAALSTSATKLVVRNLAFEATRADVQELFASAGSIKSVRLPKKFDGTHRGFAFVDFLTHAEAVSAKSSLSATHLYGRHLVIEWASEEKATTPAA